MNKSIVNFDEQERVDMSFCRDTEYWNSYYALNKAPSNASLFAVWTYETYIKQKRGKLLELGTGNGRDSIFFYDKGCNVLGVDASNTAIDILQTRKFNTNKIEFVCDDFVSLTSSFDSDFDYVYSRFSLHAINKKQENLLIDEVYKALKDGGYFFVEARSIKDEIYGKGERVAKDSYIYDGHFRRFLRIENLCTKMKEVGFSIVYAKENRGFAPFEETDPCVIRVVALKNVNTVYG